MRLLRTLGAVALLFALFSIGSVVPAVEASPISFTDSFEGATFDPFWTVIQQNGTVSPSPAQAYAGSQSAGLVSSTTGVQRELHLLHTFAMPILGDALASVAFYDDAPGTPTVYEQMTLRNSTDPTRFLTIGTQDFDPNCYVAFIATPGGNLGPNGSCTGGAPRTEATSVQRTLGWHLFEILLQPTGASFFIDSALVFSAPGVFGFDTVDLFLNGPAGPPNVTAHFDQFNLSAPAQTPIPEPATLVLVGAGLLAARLRQRRRVSRQQRRN